MQVVRSDNKSHLKIENFRGKNVTVEINCKNLLDQKVNPIVNAANVDFELGGGVAGAIRERCGKRVQAECDDYFDKRGSCI